MAPRVKPLTRKQAMAASHVLRANRAAEVPNPLETGLGVHEVVGIGPLDPNAAPPPPPARTNPYTAGAPVVPIHGTPAENVIDVGQTAKQALHHVGQVLTGKENVYGRRFKPFHPVVVGRDRHGAPVVVSPAKTEAEAQAQAFDMPITPALGLVRLGLAQLGQRAIDAPAGVAAEIQHPIRTAKQAARNTADLVRHPSAQHAAELALLGFGAASGAGSALARLEGAANALKAGEGVGAAVKRPGHAGGSLFHSPEPGVLSLTTKGGQTVEYPASRNPIARQAQRARNRHLQKKLDNGPRERVPRNKVARGFTRALDLFGPEAKVRRETRAQRSVDEALAQGPLQAMHAANAKLNRGEHVAMRVTAIEGDQALADPVGTIQRHIEKAHADFEKGAITRDEFNAEVGDLRLAEKALSDPRPEFLKALGRNRLLSKQTADMLIERGFLNPETANGRLAKIANLYRGEADRAESAPPGSFYFPLSRRYTHSLLESADNVRYGGQRPSDLGSPTPSVSAQIGSVSKPFQGTSLESHLPADIVARGLSQRYARTVRLSSAHDLFNELYQHGSPVRMSEYQVPFRSTDKARTEIQNVLAKAADTLATNPDEAEILTKDQIDALSHAISADEYSGAPLGTRIDGVMWVDRRLIPEVETSVRGGVAKVLDAITNPVRFADLYARPAYALNAVGNAGMAAITQGHLAPGAIRDAFRVTSQLGEDDAALVRSGMGESRSQSYLVKGAADTANQLNNKLATAWNKLTDVWFRDSSFLHEAKKVGYSTPEEIHRLLNDKALLSKRREVFRRARKNAVDFQSLTPVEKNAIRRVVYFYPWVSRATIWALRTVVEHPGKTYTLAALARIGGENADKQTGPQPAWMNAVGYIAFGDKPGRVDLINPSSVNTFSSAQQGLSALANTIEGVIGIGKGGGLANSLTPGAQLFVQQAGGNADTTQAGGLLGALESTPQYQALRRSGLQLNVGGHRLIQAPPATFPDTGVGPAVGPLLAGGAYPRSGDKAVIAKQYRRGLSTPDRAKQDFEAQNKAIAQAVRQGTIDADSAAHLRQANQADYQDALREYHLKKQGHSQDDIDRQLMLDDAKRQGMSLDDLNAILKQAGYKLATADEYR